MLWLADGSGADRKIFIAYSRTGRGRADMGKRTLKKCSVIALNVRRGIGEPRQKNGKCSGYQKGETDDEPCKPCIDCKLNEFYEEQ